MELSNTSNFFRKFIRLIAFKGREYLIHSNRYLLLYYINCKLYKLFEWIICKQFIKIQGVCCLYLAHGRAIGETYPGLSDFDLVIVYDCSNSLSFIANVRYKWNRIRQILPVRDLSLMSRADFISWQRNGGGMDPLDELQHWLLLAGKDLRLNDQLDLNSPTAEQDRQRFAFSHYHRLLRCALKDEVNTPLLLIILRRQIYKLFCAAVFSLYKQLLEVPRQTQRFKDWTKVGSETEISQKLIRLQQTRFHKGEISRLSFEVAAVALRELDRVAKMPLLYNQEYTTRAAPLSIPIFNKQEIIARAKRFTTEIIRDRAESFKAACLCGNGSSRGYTLHIIIDDDLGLKEIADIFRHVHELFRLFDDPWFNEHYPDAIPIVCTESMWKRELQLWPFYSNYWSQHPCILFGNLSLETKVVNTVIDFKNVSFIESERSSLSRYYKQIHLEHSKPALFDFLTLYFPRYLLQRFKADSPSTNEEVVVEFEHFESSLRNMPKAILEQYGKYDIDALLRGLPDSLFHQYHSEIEQYLEPILDI